MKLLKKPFVYAGLFGILLTGGSSYSMLKTFVLAEAISTVETTNSTTGITQAEKTAAAAATTTDTSYSDDNIQVSMETITTNNTTVYIANIQVSSAEYLKTALAKTPTAQTLPQPPLKQPQPITLSWL